MAVVERRWRTEREKETSAAMFAGLLFKRDEWIVNHLIVYLYIEDHETTTNDEVNQSSPLMP